MVTEEKSVLSPATATFPIIEIFGPTVQGEGSLVGTPVHFIRTGGCDYRCSWCDTPFAVLPEEVRKNAVRMTVPQIRNALFQLEGNPDWVVISGGNPAILNLTPLVRELQACGYKVTIETQGSRYQQWFGLLDLLTVSPKPPSSGMTTNWKMLDRVMTENPEVRKDLKVVVFDEADMIYAKEVHRRYPDITMYMSVGTFVGTSTRDDLLDRMRDNVEKALRDPDLRNVRHGLQLHVLLWSHQRGV